MRNIILLAKTLLKSGGFLSTKKNGKAKWLVPALLIFAFGSFAFSMIYMTFDLYDALASLSLAEMILPIAFGATCFVIFLFGIFYVVSVLYHAKDIEILMALPLRPYQILGAKFLTLVVYEYIVESFMLLPILVAFGIKSGANVLYYVYSAVLFFFVPVIALSMAGIIVMIVMRFTGFGKNKQAFKFVGGIIALVLAIGVNVAIQGSVTNISQEQLIAIASGQTSLVSVISNIFPGIIFAANTLIYSSAMSGLVNMFLFILCSVVAALVFVGIGQFVYLKGVAGVTETSAKRKEITDIGSKTASTPVVKAYVKKEIRLLFRSPIAFLNCVLMNFLWPIILFIPLLSGGGDMSMINEFVSQMDTGLLLAIIVGASAFVSSVNAITSTAISREGKSLYFTKYIPVPMQNQLAAKVITGMIISTIGVVFLMIAAVVVGVNIITVLVAFIISIGVVAVSSMAGMLIDVANPKLEWMNEQQAIKQNVNVLFHMLIGILIAAIAVVPVLVFHMSIVAASIYNVVVFALLLLIFLNLIRNYATSKLENMDV